MVSQPILQVSGTARRAAADSLWIADNNELVGTSVLAPTKVWRGFCLSGKELGLPVYLGHVRLARISMAFRIRICSRE